MSCSGTLTHMRYEKDIKVKGNVMILNERTLGFTSVPCKLVLKLVHKILYFCANNVLQIQTELDCMWCYVK